MLEIHKIKENTSGIVHDLKKRGIEVEKNIELVLQLDKQRIKNQQELDALLSEGNQIAQQIGQLAKKGELENLSVLKNRASEIKIALFQLPQIILSHSPLPSSQKLIVLSFLFFSSFSIKAIL